MRTLLASFLLISIFTACADDRFGSTAETRSFSQASNDIITASEISKTDATQSDTAELIFSADQGVTLTQEIFSGDLLTVRYDLSRMEDCKSKGRPALQFLTGYFSSDRQDPEQEPEQDPEQAPKQAPKQNLEQSPEQSTEIFEYRPNYTTSHQLQSTMITVPEGKTLSMWFQVVDANGCESWDTNEEQHYQIAISQPELSVDEPTALAF